MIRARVIQPGAHVGGEMKFQFYDNELCVQFEALVGDSWTSWIRLQYVISDYWTGEQHEIDDKIYLAASRPRFDLQRIHLLAASGSRRAPSASPRVAGDKPASQRDCVRLRLPRLHPFRAEISPSLRLPARRSRRTRNSARRYGQKGATGTRRPASGGLDPARKTDPGRQDGSSRGPASG